MTRNKLNQNFIKVITKSKVPFIWKVITLPLSFVFICFFIFLSFIFAVSEKVREPRNKKGLWVLIFLFSIGIAFAYTGETPYECGDYNCTAFLQNGIWVIPEGIFPNVAPHR